MKITVTAFLKRISEIIRTCLNTFKHTCLKNSVFFIQVFFTQKEHFSKISEKKTTNC